VIEHSLNPEAAMRVLTRGATALGALAFIACSGDTAVTSPRRPIPSPEFSIDGAGAAGQVGAGDRVSGTATIILPAFGNAREHYSLEAKRRRDGTVTGEFNEFSQQMGGQRIRAHVVCFTLIGDSARLSAQIDKSDVPFGPVGSYVVWSVVDNGHGRKAAPDETTDIFFGGTAAQAAFHCQTGFPLTPYFALVRGNLRVR
jgi:hypothetical protein